MQLRASTSVGNQYHQSLVKFLLPNNSCLCWSPADCKGFVMVRTHLSHALGPHVIVASSQYWLIEVMSGMSYSTDNYVSLFGSILLSVNRGVVSSEWKSLGAHREVRAFFVCLPQCKHNFTHLLMEQWGKPGIERLTVCSQGPWGCSVGVWGGEGLWAISAGGLDNLKWVGWYDAPKLQNCQLIFQGLITASCNY